MFQRHPLCPIDEATVAWELTGLPDDGRPMSGVGLTKGLRRLWTRALGEAVEANGAARAGAMPLLMLGTGEPRVPVALAIGSRPDEGLVRLKGWMALGPPGLLVVDGLVQTHGERLLGSSRWEGRPQSPGLESEPLIILAAVLDDPQALLRAVRPKH